MTLPTTRLIHGDCLDVMPTLPANSVQMVFADLPYSVTRAHWDVALSLPRMWNSVDRVASPSAAMIFTATQPFCSHLVLSNQSAFRYDLTWVKSATTGFLNAGRMPLRAHEHVNVFYRKLPTYNAQKTVGKSWRKLVARASNQKYGGYVDDSSPQKSDGMRHPTSVLNIAQSNKKSMHPTQKPVALLEWLIRTYTNEGDTVLDPTAGSGTTAIAALRMGRHSICIEKDKGYYDVMCKRVADERARLEAEV